MRVETKLVVGVLVPFSISVRATPGSGVLFNIIPNRAQTPAAFHSDAAGEAADGRHWYLQQQNRRHLTARDQQ